LGKKTSEVAGLRHYRGGFEGGKKVLFVAEKMAASFCSPLTKRPYIESPDGLGGQHPGACLFGMADGSVHALSSNIDPNVLERLMTIAGGEAIATP
jgi:hypothetical protein